MKKNIVITRRQFFYRVFQAAHIVIASRAKSTAWQSPETVFKMSTREFKNCFRVAYQI